MVNLIRIKYQYKHLIKYIILNEIFSLFLDIVHNYIVNPAHST